MTTVTHKGIQFTEKMLKEEKTSTIVDTYNEIATENGEKPVSKFADRKTAEKRLWALLLKYGKAAKKDAKDGATKSRAKLFNYVAIGQPKPSREDNPENPVLRNRILQRLLTPEGLTFNQAVEVVKKFDKDRVSLGKEIRNNGLTIETRAYEAIRLIHYYLNYSLKQEGTGDDAPIRVVGNRKS